MLESIENFLNDVIFKEKNEKVVVLHYSEPDSNTIAATYTIEPKERINILEEWLKNQPTGSWGSRMQFTKESQATQTILLDKHNMLMHYRIAKIKSILDE